MTFGAERVKFSNARFVSAFVGRARRKFKLVKNCGFNGMRKYYYVCPRCGRCYKRYIPRRKAKCHFCSTVWKTRKAKGTRSAFSWTATLVCLLAIAALAYFGGRRLGLLSTTPDPVSVSENQTTGLDADGQASELENEGVAEEFENTEDAENAENVDAEDVDVSEDLGVGEDANNLEDANGGEGSTAE